MDRFVKQQEPQIGTQNHHSDFGNQIFKVSLNFRKKLSEPETYPLSRQYSTHGMKARAEIPLSSLIFGVFRLLWTVFHVSTSKECNEDITGGEIENSFANNCFSFCSTPY